MAEFKTDNLHQNIINSRHKIKDSLDQLTISFQNLKQYGDRVDDNYDQLTIDAKLSKVQIQNEIIRSKLKPIYGLIDHHLHSQTNNAFKLDLSIGQQPTNTNDHTNNDIGYDPIINDTVIQLFRFVEQDQQLFTQFKQTFRTISSFFANLTNHNQYQTIQQFIYFLQTSIQIDDQQQQNDKQQLQNNQKDQLKALQNQIQKKPKTQDHKKMNEYKYHNTEPIQKLVEKQQKVIEKQNKEIQKNKQKMVNDLVQQSIKKQVQSIYRRQSCDNDQEMYRNYQSLYQIQQQQFQQQQKQYEMLDKSQKQLEFIRQKQSYQKQQSRLDNQQNQILQLQLTIQDILNDPVNNQQSIQQQPKHNMDRNDCHGQNQNNQQNQPNFRTQNNIFDHPNSPNYNPTYKPQITNKYPNQSGNKQHLKQDASLDRLQQPTQQTYQNEVLNNYLYQSKQQTSQSKQQIFQSNQQTFQSNQQTHQPKQQSYQNQMLENYLYQSKQLNQGVLDNSIQKERTLNCMKNLYCEVPILRKKQVDRTKKSQNYMLDSYNSEQVKTRGKKTNESCQVPNQKHRLDESQWRNNSGRMNQSQISNSNQKTQRMGGKTDFHCWVDSIPPKKRIIDRGVNLKQVLNQQ